MYRGSRRVLHGFFEGSVRLLCQDLCSCGSGILASNLVEASGSEVATWGSGLPGLGFRGSGFRV